MSILSSFLKDFTAATLSSLPCCVPMCCNGWLNFQTIGWRKRETSPHLLDMKLEAGTADKIYIPPFGEGAHVLYLCLPSSTINDLTLTPPFFGVRTNQPHQYLWNSTIYISIPTFTSLAQFLHEMAATASQLTYLSSCLLPISSPWNHWSSLPKQTNPNT